MTNLNILGFEKRDGIDFSNLIEKGVKYSIYSKMPEVLKKGISARLQLVDEIYK